METRLARPRLLGGRYELGDRLGRGGMAAVHAARDRTLDRDVAVKVLREDMAERGESRRRFEREAPAAASLVHPHAVAVYDAGEDDGTAYLVMERLPGRTLADEMEGGPIEPERARRLPSRSSTPSTPPTGWAWCTAT